VRWDFQYPFNCKFTKEFTSLVAMAAHTDYAIHWFDHGIIDYSILINLLAYTNVENGCTGRT